MVLRSVLLSSIVLTSAGAIASTKADSDGFTKLNINRHKIYEFTNRNPGKPYFSDIRLENIPYAVKSETSSSIGEDNTITVKQKAKLAVAVTVSYDADYFNDSGDTPRTERSDTIYFETSDFLKEDLATISQFAKEKDWHVRARFASRVLEILPPSYESQHKITWEHERSSTGEGYGSEDLGPLVRKDQTIDYTVFTVRPLASEGRRSK